MPDTLNDQHRFAPHDVAGMFDVSVMTVRRWADYHKEHLSESANPPAGQTRAFTWADVEKLRQIKALRDAGLSVDAINNRLTNTVTDALTPIVMPDSLAAHPAGQEGQGATLAPTVGNDAIMLLARRLEAVEAATAAANNTRRDMILIFCAGFVAACLVFLLLLGLAVAYGR